MVTPAREDLAGQRVTPAQRIDQHGVGRRAEGDDHRAGLGFPDHPRQLVRAAQMRDWSSVARRRGSCVEEPDGVQAVLGSVEEDLSELVSGVIPADEPVRDVRRCAQYPNDLLGRAVS